MLLLLSLHISAILAVLLRGIMQTSQHFVCHHRQSEHFIRFIFLEKRIQLLWYFIRNIWIQKIFIKALKPLKPPSCNTSWTSFLIFNDQLKIDEKNSFLKLGQCIRVHLKERKNLQTKLKNYVCIDLFFLWIYGSNLHPVDCSCDRINMFMLVSAPHKPANLVWPVQSRQCSTENKTS